MTYFSASGPLAKRLGAAYRPREQQQQLVDIIKGLQRRDRVAVNAPVAVGKNDALGVGALLSGRKTVLSTNTLALLDQLAAAAETWREDFPSKHIVVVRGRSNYVCAAKLAALQTQHDNAAALGFHDKKRLKVLQFGQTHELIAGGPEGVEELRQTSCPGRRECSQADTCHYFNRRDEAGGADLVVTSHAMVFASIDYPIGSGDEARPWFGTEQWIADEGDQLIDAAQEDLSVSGWGLRSALMDANCTVEACAAIKVFVDNLHVALGENKSVTLDQRQWQSFVKNRLPALEECLAKWHIDLDADAPKSFTAVKRLVNLLRAMSGSDVVAGFSVSKSGGIALAKLSAEDKRIAGINVQWRRLSLGGSLRRYVGNFSRFAAVSGSVALPSANGPDFTYFVRRSGISFTSTVAITSPIDYSRMRVVHAPITDKDRVQRAKTFAQFAASVAQQVGNCLVLCCSYTTVREVEEAFGAYGVPVLAQTQDSTETVAALAQQIKSGTMASIVGNKSAWIGLDLDARYKTCVIIEKLPMPSPDVDLVLDGSIRRDGQSAWGSYGAQQAMKQAVQGVGRALRREVDECLLIVCDPRFEGDYAAAIPTGAQVCNIQDGIAWAASISRASEPPQKPVTQLDDDEVSLNFLDILETT